MAGTKFDGIIEAVRYTSSGKVAMVRLYERRGATWSDHVLIERKGLIERLKKGQRFVIGRRRTYLAGTFETDEAVRLLSNGSIGTNNQIGERDFLDGAPIF